MKRKLLYLTSIVLFSAFSSINAQTKTWDFGTVAGGWTSPNTAGYTTNVVIDNLGIYPAEAAAPTSIGQVDNNNTTFTGTGGFSATQRFKMGGTSTVVGNIPTARFLYFTAAGSGTLTIWFRGGNNSSTRSISVSDGTNVTTQASVNGANVTMVVPYTNVNGNIYIYDDLACNIYRMEVVGPLGTTALIPALGVDDFQADASSNVYSNGKLVFVSNVKSDTKVDVYGISGVLVKSFKTGSDTSFDLNTGIYVVKSKSAEGEKSAKVLVN